MWLGGTGPGVTEATTSTVGPRNLAALRRNTTTTLNSALNVEQSFCNRLRCSLLLSVPPRHVCLVKLLTKLSWTSQGDIFNFTPQQMANYKMTCSCNSLAKRSLYRYLGTSLMHVQLESFKFVAHIAPGWEGKLRAKCFFRIVVWCGICGSPETNYTTPDLASLRELGPI